MISWTYIWSASHLRRLLLHFTDCALALARAKAGNSSAAESQ